MSRVFKDLSFDEIVSNPCPFCKAPVGEACRMPNEKRVQACHENRPYLHKMRKHRFFVTHCKECQTERRLPNAQRCAACLMNHAIKGHWRSGGVVRAQRIIDGLCVTWECKDKDAVVGKQHCQECRDSRKQRPSL